MFDPSGNWLVMTQGDYGVVLPVRVRPQCDGDGECQTCETCDVGLLDDDKIQLEITKGGATLVERFELWNIAKANGGVVPLELTKAEAEALKPGLYTLRVRLISDGAIRNTRLCTTLEVRV